MEKKISDWTGERASHWTKEAAPIGSRDQLLHGIFEAIWAKYQTSPEFAQALVKSHWLKDQVDELQLGTLDQDVRNYLKQQFAAEGVKVSESK